MVLGSLDETAGDGRGQQRVARADHADGGHEVFGCGVLEEETGGPRGQGRVDVAVEVERGQDDHTWFVVRSGQDVAGGFQAVQSRHADVHQDHVGSGAPDRVDGFRAVGRLGDHVDAVCREDHPEAGADQCLVIGDHHARRAGHEASKGISAVMR
jgi:hypothetical protein